MSFLVPRVSFSSNLASLFNVTRHNCSILFNLKIDMLWTKEAHQNANFQTFRLAWKLTKFLMSFFKQRVSFPLKFVLPFSVMTHNYSKTFWRKHYMIWASRAHQRIIFQNFVCFNESSPVSSYHFWNHKVRVYSNFASLFNVIKDNSSVIFRSNRICFGEKEPIEVKFSDFWLFGWKCRKFLMSRLELQVSFSLNFPSLVSVMSDNSSVFF